MPLAALVVVVALGVVFRQRLIDWFSGTATAGNFAEPVRITVGGLNVDTALAPDPPRQNDNRVRVVLTDASGNAVDDAEILVTYDMPEMGSMPEMRGTTRPRGRGNGRYESGFDLPMGGSWGLTVDIKKGSTTATARYSFTVGTPGLVSLEDGGGDDEPVAQQVAPAPVLAPRTYSPTALTALRAALDQYARVSTGLAENTVAQDAARRLALALRDGEKAIGHGDHEVAAMLATAAAHADAVAATSDVAAARKAFADLSRPVVDVAAADARLAAEWKLFECPMAPGYQRWFQKETEPVNPYFGREMAACVSEVEWTSPAAPPPPPPPSETGEIRIDQARRAALGIRTAEVVKAPMKLDVRAVGRVTYDETRLTDVTLKIGGFITDLRVAATGQPVKKGQVLFTLYSPELYAAQQEYLVALRGRAAGSTGLATASDSLLRASEQKLRLWGMSAAQIDRLAASGEVQEHVPVPSPASGHVIEKLVVEGGAVEPGMRLFRIAALDQVWIEADLYEPDLRHVKPGTAARIRLDYLPGETREGKVTFVYPYLDPVTRTGRVRIALPNRGLALKPDMYATVELAIDLGERVQVPTQAIIVTGTRRVVFVDGGRGRLTPKVIEVGAAGPELTEVVRGLSAGDLVVTSGNFLVASESRLRSAATFWKDEPGPGTAP